MRRPASGRRRRPPGSPGRSDRRSVVRGFVVAASPVSARWRATRIAKISSNDRRCSRADSTSTPAELDPLDDVRQRAAGVVDDDPEVARAVLA